MLAAMPAPQGPVMYLASVTHGRPIRTTSVFLEAGVAASIPASFDELSTSSP
jgi:hypothetical protein